MDMDECMSIKYRMEPGCDDLVPKRKHADDAGYDLHSRIEMTIEPGEVKLFPTGLYIEVPPGYELQVRPRSGMALKESIGILNTPGTVDAGYRGEVGVILFNFGKTTYNVHRGDRIAQGVFASLPRVCLVKSIELSESVRGAKGFGSTGKG